MSTKYEEDFEPKERYELSSFRTEIRNNEFNIFNNVEEYYDDNGDIVARIIIGKNRNTKEKWLLNLFISKQYRGHGLSYQLLDVAVKRYDIQGLTVELNNKVAVHTYEKYGFKLNTEEGGGRLCAMRLN